MPKALLLTLVIIGVIVAGTVLVLAATYISSVRRILRRRHRVKNLAEVHDARISRASLDGLTHGFEEDENVVFWADREAVIVVLPAVIGLLLISVACFVMSGVLAVHLHEYRYTYKHSGGGQPTHISIQLKYFALLPLALGIAVFSIAANKVLRWRAKVRSITNMNSRVDIQPWAGAFWLWNDEKHDPQPLHRIERVEEEGSKLGRIFGYGTLQIFTLMQEGQDDDSHEWHYVRSYEEVAAKHRELSKAAKTAALSPESSAEKPERSYIPLWPQTMN